jgi:hypothetical protein
VNAETSKTLIAEINQILQDLGVADKVQVVVK